MACGRDAYSILYSHVLIWEPQDGDHMDPTSFPGTKFSPVRNRLCSRAFFPLCRQMLCYTSPLQCCRLSGLELSCVELGAVFAWELLPKGPRHVPMLPWCNQLQLWQEVVRASCCVPLPKLLKSVHFLINRPFLVIWELETAMNMEEGWSSCGAPMV